MSKEWVALDAHRKCRACTQKGTESCLGERTMRGMHGIPYPLKMPRKTYLKKKSTRVQLGKKKSIK